MIPFVNLILGSSAPSANRGSTKSIYEYVVTLLDGTSVPMSQFRGKKILLVNVASQCAFTPQYEALEALFQKYEDRLVIIGFPSNDFLGQEPGTNEEIKTFCKTKYHVTFPVSQKVSVIGDDRTEIYRWLTDPTFNGWNKKSPRWNFYKYLIDERGELVQVFASTTRPFDDEIVDAILNVKRP
jgi:glutathione peroxidase